MRKLIFTAGVAATAIAGIAAAAALQPHGLMRADSNGDGIVQRSEFFAMADERFKRLDVNGDGVIAATEMRGPRMARIDANGDGTVSKAEFAAQENARFQQVDTNGDKQITEAELKAAHDRRGPWGGGPRFHGGPNGPIGARMGAHMLERLDTNKDGRISRDEMRAGADEHFARLDGNHDGFIDQAEITAQREKMRAHFKQMLDQRGGRWGKRPGDMPPPPPGAIAPERDTGQ